MTADIPPIDRAKFVAAKHAVGYIEDGMRVGLGSGSTAAWMVRCLGGMVREDGINVTGVATSTRTAKLARQLGIPIRTLDEVQWLDLTIDGADEYDADLNLIKGGGGALLREKIVATASDQMVMIADPAKHVDVLGGCPLPVEVIPFGWQTTQALIEEMLANQDVMGCSISLRLNVNKPFCTDEGNYILDLHLRRIGDPRQLSLELNQIPGVVEHGLFLDMCDVGVIGSADGTVKVRNIRNGTIEQEQVRIIDTDNLFLDIVN
ncbi:MAG: ribose-5-phosphate isomerase RpiA [Rhodobacteraceae bacterium]|nr:ribose-5-phosphate isomerase RpiA [Paracoccaceae bacterium]